MVNEKSTIPLPIKKGYFLPWAFTIDIRTIALLLLFLLTGIFKYLLRFVSVDHLQPVLAPTAFIVSAFTGLHFSWMPSEGFYNQAAGVLINESCAGSGFFLLCWALCVFHYVRIRPKGNIPVLIALMFLAFHVTVLINAFRIISSLCFLDFTFVGAAVPALHKTIGIITFLSGLMAFNFIVQTAFGKRRINEPAL
jgi:exosortase K